MGGEIPGKLLFEDKNCVVLQDINPQAPIHFLVIPRKAIPRLNEAETSDKELLGHLLLVAQAQARAQRVDEGFRIVINNGPMAGESVPHLHLHVLGGRTMHWPPG